MDKVNECIQNVEGLIPTRSKDEVATLNSTAVLDDILMLSQFQQRKSVAQMAGKIDFDVAQWLYNLMGEGGISHFNGAPLAHRITALEVMVNSQSG
jgi:hypothetical protein